MAQPVTVIDIPAKETGTPERVAVPNASFEDGAAFLLALSYYDQIDEVGRDQGLTFQALQALRVERTAAVAAAHRAAKPCEIGRERRQHREYDGPGDHARSAASFLTGAHPYKTNGKDIVIVIGKDRKVHYFKAGAMNGAEKDKTFKLIKELMAK